MASPRQILCNLIIRQVTDEGTPKLVHLRSSSNFIISLNTKGIRISFPRNPDRSIWSWYSVDLATTDSALYHITIELPPRGFTATHHELTVKHNELLSGLDGELSEYRLVNLQITPHFNTTVTGFGLPFHGANATIDDWVNKHTPIAGVAPLPEILKTRNFTLLVKASKNDLDNMIKGINDRHQRSDYGYGTDHQWNWERYNRQIPKLRGMLFPETIRFKTKTKETLLGPRSTFKMFGTFIMIWNMSTMFLCLLEPSRDEFENRHWRAVHRALKGSFTKLQVEFLPNRSRQLVTWDASPVIYGDSELPKDIDSYDRIPLVLLRPDTGDGHDFSPIAHDKYEQVNEELERDRVKLICESNAYGEELRVQAINRLSDAKVWPTMQQDTLALNKKAIFNELLIGNGLWNLHHSGSNIDLTPFDLFKDMPVEIRDTCLGFVFEGDRGKVQQYFSKLHFGLGIVSGPAGTGKSTLASAITVLMCLNQTIKHVYVSAASNEATDNILDRIDTLAKSIIKKLTEDGISANQLMVVRGYRIKDEQDKCLRALTGLRFKPGPRSSSAWRFKNSLCWWTLRVLGSSAVPQLTPSDNSELWELHQKLKELLVPGAVKDPNISEFAGLLKLAEELDPKKRTKNPYAI
ncbi:hypothetical protein QL093DRAFT_2642008 [Fusarium oxysporum]|nr:hypothetical protein QL093DRAFT_2642008 [Fusarium oxysporum]